MYMLCISLSWSCTARDEHMFIPFRSSLMTSMCESCACVGNVWNYDILLSQMLRSFILASAFPTQSLAMTRRHKVSRPPGDEDLAWTQLDDQEGDAVRRIGFAQSVMRGEHCVGLCLLIPGPSSNEQQHVKTPATGPEAYRATSFF